MCKKQLFLLVGFMLGYSINLLSMQFDSKEYGIIHYKWAEYYYWHNDMQNSRHHLEMAASMNHVSSIVMLGLIKFEEKKIQEAERFFRLAIKKGSIQAQYYLAVILENKDELDEAIIWHERAASAGIIKAENHLGIIYLKRGHSKRALYHLRLGAEAGDMFAQYNLGILFEPTDIFKASSYYQLAAEQGYGFAVEALKRIDVNCIDENG